MKFGRKGLKTDYRTLQFSKYALPSLPPPPPSVDQFAEVIAEVGASFAELFPMDHNDTVGDCTWAGWAHAATLFQGMIGQGFIPAADEVLADYFAMTGGEDTGLYCLDVLKYIQQNGVLGGDKLLAYVGINPKNHTHVKQAIQLFGCVYIGFQVQGGAIPDFEARKPWDYSSNMTQDGHCVAVGGYNDNAVGYANGLLRLATWGNDQFATWGWWDEVVDECYAILPAEAKDPMFASGLDLTQLSIDLALVRS